MLGAYAQPASGNSEPQVEEIVAVEEFVPTEEVVVADEQPAVQESEIAHKMTQAEKAQNAKENDSWGGAITIIAMCIVVSALVILSILFLGFGKISKMLLSKKKREAHGLSKEDLSDDHEHVDSGDAIAAIAMALAEHFGQTHDLEDTILTIRTMRKAYSPWNSKIYNLREVPGLQHTPFQRASAFKTPSRES